jgi:hypothetical protein
MACCVFLAAVLGGLGLVKALLTLTPLAQMAPQEWRLASCESVG